MNVEAETNYAYYMYAFILFILLLLYVIYLYNNLIQRKNQLKNSNSTIDIMLKRRFDLLPNLVDICKQYLHHEENVFINISKIRTEVAGKSLYYEKLDTDALLSKPVSNLFVLSEAYPELKSSENFLHLQATWFETEDQIAAARRFYNASVYAYNNAVQLFPSNIIATIAGFKAEPFYKQ